mgnify:CR=1 FL=1
MNINCSEKCLYERDGICTLNRIIISSGNISSGCPYYKNKQDNIRGCYGHIKQVQKQPIHYTSSP